MLKNIISEIEENLKKYYAKLYLLNNFTYNCTERMKDNIKFVDIDIFADMTLLRDPKKNPYVRGMMLAIMERKKQHLFTKPLEDAVAAYMAKIRSTYLHKPSPSTFPFTVQFTPDGKYQIFYRNTVEDTILLMDLKALGPVEDPAAARKAGYATVQKWSMELNPPLSQNEIQYDGELAAQWAYDNAFATPEYPSIYVQGTDCANYVSKAINVGGIPEDFPGGWYRANPPGTLAGLNWLRTGFNKINGIEVYMTSKKYFAVNPHINAVLVGNFMFWNTTSHVAMVTYSDGTVIKYSQHGAVQTRNTVYRNENVTFYQSTMEKTLPFMIL